MNPVPNFQPSWNIAPSQSAPVIRLNPETGQRRLDLLSWGLVPHWAKYLKAEKKPINARSETVASSPMFRGAYVARRCLGQAGAFYEWRHRGSTSTPIYILGFHTRVALTKTITNSGNVISQHQT